MFLGKELSWYYNERHHGKGPINGVGGPVKNVIFRKVKSGHVLINTLKEFAEAAMRFVPNVSTLYLPNKNIMEEPTDIANAPAIKFTCLRERLYMMFLE